MARRISKLTAFRTVMIRLVMSFRVGVSQVLSLLPRKGPGHILGAPIPESDAEVAALEMLVVEPWT